MSEMKHKNLATLADGTTISFRPLGLLRWHVAFPGVDYGAEFLALWMARLYIRWYRRQLWKLRDLEGR